MSRRFIGGDEAQWVAQEVGKVTADNAADRYESYLRNAQQLENFLGSNEPQIGDASREVARQIKEKFNL